MTEWLIAVGLMVLAGGIVSAVIAGVSVYLSSRFTKHHRTRL